LNQLGALAIKNSVYVLPANDETLEDLQWLRRGIVTEGGDAWIFRASAVAGHTTESLREAFNAMRTEDYASLGAEARSLLNELRADDTAVKQDADGPSIEARARKLARQFEAIGRIDFFGAPAREEAMALMHEIEHAQEQRETPEMASSDTEFSGRRWVTRRGVKVDRIASAWLIRRFIDPAPEFVFVDPETYRHASGELRFDMFEGEFTHEGDRCTFEVLLQHAKLEKPGLAVIAEMVHDIDLKEATFRRPETHGLSAMIDGIAQRHPGDEARLHAGFELFDALFAQFNQ
jgi:hypothetical protein